MAKILILDVYKHSRYRQSKDTNGGFGTENNLGKGLTSQFLSQLAKYATFWPPLTALNLISELVRAGHKVFYSNSIDDVDESLDFVFIASSIINYRHEVMAIKHIKTNYKNIKIFTFGPFASIESQQYMLAGSTVIIGEAEFLAQENLRFNDTYIHELHGRKLVNVIGADPDKLAPPLWSTIKMPKMRNFIFSGSLTQTVPIIASRGCPYSCFEYCTYPLAQGRKVRAMNADKLCEDIMFINKTINAKHYVFRDPVFTINKKYSEGLLAKMSSLPKTISYAVETHLNNIDEPLTEKLKEANVNVVKFGIESASSEVMNDVSRYSIKHEEEISRINLLQQKKIKTHAMYILCQPSDTEDTIKETIDYSLKLNTDLAQFSLFTPYPGTPYFEKNKHLITEKDYEKFTQFNLVFKHKLFNNKDAHHFLGQAHKKFYLKKLIGF